MRIVTAAARRGAGWLSCHLPPSQPKARSSPSWHQAVRLLGSSRVASLARSKGSAQRLQHRRFEVATGGMVVDLLGACASWRQHAGEPADSLAICLSLRRRLALLPLGIRLCGYWAVAVCQALRGVRAQRKRYRCSRRREGSKHSLCAALLALVVVLVD